MNHTETLIPIVDPAGYAYNPYAIPVAVAAFAMLAVGVTAYLRERGSRVSVLFLLMTLADSVWLASFACMYSAVNEQTALWWAKAAYLGAPCIPSAIYQFTVVALGTSLRHKRLVRMSWFLSIFFMVAILGTDGLIGGLYRYWWGYSPRYGPLSTFYLTFFFGVLFLSLREYWLAYRQAPPGTVQQRRIRAFLIAFHVVSLGSVDYFAMYGIALYPFGYLPVLGFVVLALRAINRYRLVDITEAFAAKHILDGMSEAVLVFDPQGTIQLVNGAASKLLGIPEHGLRGRPISMLLTDSSLSEQMHRMAQQGAEHLYSEASYARPSGGMRTLSLSMSTIRSRTTEPEAIVCFLRDITSRKQTEVTLTRLAEITKDWKGMQETSQSTHPLLVDLLTNRSASPEASSGTEETTATTFGLASAPLSRLKTPWFFASSRRLFGSLFMILAVPMGLLIWLETTQIVRSLEGKAIEQNTASARLVAKAVQEHFEGLMRYVESFAGRPSLAQFVETRNADAVRIYLEELVTQNNQIDRALVVDVNGILWSDYPHALSLSGNNLSDQDWYRGVSKTNRTYVSELYLRRALPQKYLVSIATPIRNGRGKTVGYLAGQHALQSLTEWLMQNQPSAEGAVLLIDRHGKRALVPSNRAPLDLSSHPAVQDVLSGHEGAARMADPVSGEPSLISYTPVGSTGWAVLMRLPLALIMAPAQALRHVIIGLAVAGFLVMLIVAFFWLNALRRYHRVLLTVDHAKERYLTNLQHLLTERTRAEEALRQLAFIVESSNDAIIGQTLDGKIFHWNKSAEQIYGYSFAEMKGRSMSLLASSERSQELAQLLTHVASGGPIKRVETVWKSKDGRRLDVAVTISPINDAAGQIIGVSAISYDISERKQAEEDLKRAHEELSRSHAELKTAHLQLIQAAKMESVGRLAAGVAHEVKNPLAVILQGVDFLSTRLNGDESTALILRYTADAVRRADAVIRGLLDFSTSRQLELTPEDLNSTIDQVLLLVKHELDRSHVIVAKVLGRDLPEIRLDRNKMQQVFVNIFMNAIHAMPEGGTLVITTHQQPLEGPDWRNGSSLHTPPVVVNITDTGTGIPEEALQKVFDPFFTTKPTGQGTGLGLTVTKNIVELHGGTIELKNRPEGGVEVTIILQANTQGGERNGKKAYLDRR